MLQNYLKIAWRNVLKSRLLSFISLSGLAVGMAACLLLLHYVTFELSYEKFHDSADRIYRLRYERADENGEAVSFASCCPPAAPKIRDTYPEVEKIARIFRRHAVVAHDERKFLEERVYFAEPDFLDILKFEFISGDPLNGLRESNRAFISRSTALKYFGDRDPLEKILTVNGRADYRVVGIFEDVPQNSHLKFDILLSFENIASHFGPEIMEAWGHTGFYTYLRLQPEVDIEVFKNKLADLVETEFGEVLRQYNLTLQLVLQPIREIHLTSHFMQEYELNGDRDAVYFLLIIALFVIVIAWVNYVNLSTAASSSRAREIGLRKVVGATRSQLRVQLFLEIVFLNLFSVALALTLVDLSLPFFSQITGTPSDYNLWGAGWFWSALAIMFLVGVFLPGLYPVAVISSFKPVDALRDKLRYVVNGVVLRKCLVVFQFMMAFGLIAGTLVVYKQVNFMKQQDLGFAIDRTLIVTAPRVRDETFNEKADIFKETLLTQVSVKNASFVTEVPGRQILWDAGGIYRAGEGVEGSRNYQIVGCDYNFFDLFELRLLRGRQFSREFSTDDKALILNQTAVRWMGFENIDEAIGKQVDYWGELFTIIGVVSDYHQQSLKAAYEPTLFRLMPYGRGNRGVFAVKLEVQNTRESVDKIHQHFEEFFPGNPFVHFFLDDYYDQQYRSDELFGQVLSIFSLLAIFVTGLGVFGLSFFTVLQRTKEIGIRKVLGADVRSIVFLLMKELLILVAVANLIAWPLTYFIMRHWLDHFANRIELHQDLFISAALTTFLVALVTIVFQVVKAAAANPVESLRYE